MIPWTTHLPANTLSNIFPFKNGIGYETVNISFQSTLPMRVIS